MNKYVESIVCVSIVLMKRLPELALPIRLQFNEIMSRKIYLSIGWRIEWLTSTKSVSLWFQQELYSFLRAWYYSYAA